ncbi:ABC-type uncharacterized transport system auxiliary subunit [Nitrobacteraceae bacterium AZCC 1564]
MGLWRHEPGDFHRRLPQLNANAAVDGFNQAFADIAQEIVTWTVNNAK